MIRGVVYLDQCRFGAKSMKPTMLLTANAELMWDFSLVSGPRPWCIQHFGNIKHAIVCNCCGGHEVVLTGRNEDGSYKTAAAKTYPPGMCECLGNTVVNNPKCKSVGHFGFWNSQDPEVHELLEYYFPLDPFSENIFEDAGYAPDFHARPQDS